MTSPQGEVLNFPAEGVAAMSALGWEVTGQPEPEQKPARQRTTRKRPTTK
ncbi:MAG: hypothetical protein L0K65_07885 [Actinomyces sp.]|nr:hypothetical protein [Actinomyces sp.]